MLQTAEDTTRRSKKDEQEAAEALQEAKVGQELCAIHRFRS